MKLLSFVVGRSVVPPLGIACQLGLVVVFMISVGVQFSHSSPSTTVRTVALSGQPAPRAVPFFATSIDFILR